MSWFKRPQRRGMRIGDGENEAFIGTLTDALNAVATVTQAHVSTWGLGQEQRWSFDQDEGLLCWHFDDRIVRGPAQIIGTHAEAEAQWLWAWANPSLAPALTGTARRVREWGRQRGIVRLTQGAWEATEMQAWAMTSLACQLGGLQAAYRGLGEGADVFFGFDQVSIHMAA